MKDGFVKVAVASPSLKVGDTEYNADRIIALMAKAKALHVKVLVFPELSITGYTAGDLFFQSRLLHAALAALERIREESKGSDTALFVGLPLQIRGKLYNTAALIQNGEVKGLIPKTNIPSYQEFYESRWFTPSPEENEEVQLFGSLVPFGNKLLFQDAKIPSLVLSAEICEDCWVPYSPSLMHAIHGATVIANLSCSDELIGKEQYRNDLVRMQSAKLVAAYLYADAGEGESTTDMVFAGHDIIAENGTILTSSFLENDRLIVTEVDTERLCAERVKQTTYPSPSLSGFRIIPLCFKEETCTLTRLISPFPFVPEDDRKRESCAERIVLLQALGLKKRLEHTHARAVVVGLSGGLDSTLALLVCVRAFKLLSRSLEGIIAISMPCFGTTKRTRSNAEELASSLGVSFRQIDIRESVRRHFADIGQSEDVLDVTYENAQARERTQVLMDVANKEGGMVIGTGDLSELALGWATYNGDHMSMYAVNASVPKTLVRHLVRYCASISPDAVKNVLLDVLATPVSPELLPAKGDGTISQVTEDLVGPYELHDFYLYYALRYGFAPAKVFRLALYAFQGVYDGKTILKWLRTFYRRFFAQQFKRSCLPDGPKVGSITLSPRSDWRMPSDAESTVWLSQLDEITL